MPPATAVRLVRQVALGLEHCHRKGLIHRDVNPYNILVTHDGIGQAGRPGPGDRPGRGGSGHARGGHGRHVRLCRPRAGAALARRRYPQRHLFARMYTLPHVCGQVPFPGPSLPEKLLGHQAIEPTPLCRMVPGLPEGLSEVVRRMMRKSPTSDTPRRWKSPRPSSPTRTTTPGLRQGGRAGLLRRCGGESWFPALRR